MNSEYGFNGFSTPPSSVRSSVSTKYPRGLGSDHIPRLETFVKDLNAGMKNAFPRSTALYNRSHILLLSWKDDDLGTLSEIEEMEALFQDVYHFTSERYEIPTARSDGLLEEVLVRTRNNHADEGDLLIVYYGGHGMLDEQGNCLWKAWNGKRNGRIPSISPTVNWTELEQGLDRAMGDVALILDCCHASGSSRRKSGGMKELLAAGGKDGKASGVQSNSFTKALIRELKDLHGQTCDLSVLQARLFENYKRHDLKLTPIRVDLSGRLEGAASIKLMRQEATHGQDQQSYDSTCSSEALVTESMNNNCRVIISVHLEDYDQIPLLQEWKNWLKNAPQNIAGLAVKLEDCVELEAVYESNSKLLIVSMPLGLWNVMPSHPAYSFIGAVRSKNLLQKWRCADETVPLKHPYTRNFPAYPSVPGRPSMPTPPTSTYVSPVYDLHGTDPRRSMKIVHLGVGLVSSPVAYQEDAGYDRQSKMNIRWTLEEERLLKRMVERLSLTFLSRRRKSNRYGA